MATLPSKEKRPTGITIFAILFGIGTIASIALIIFFSMPAITQSIFGSLSPSFDSFMNMYGPWIAIVFVISAIFNGLITFGLATGSKFLRMLILIIAGINAIVDLFYFNVIGFVINIILIWYLKQPYVKKYFGLEPTPTY